MQYSRLLDKGTVVLLLLLGVSITIHAKGVKQASIEYSVAVPDTQAEMFDITATLHNISADTIIFNFPIWAPGAYDVVNFGAFVHDFSASTGQGKPLRVLRLDTSTYRIIGVQGDVLRLHYRVQDIENLPNSLWFGLSDVEPEYAFAVGTALFGYPSGYKDIPYTVTYSVPKGWDIAIGLDPIPGIIPHAYSARDYDELVDAPVQMGTFQRREFTVRGTSHLITLSAPVQLTDSIIDEVVKMTRNLVELESSFFGDMPYSRYVFQIYLVYPGPGDIAFGALEHSNSSTYRMPYSPQGDLVQSLAPVIAHEYWHLWSPKRFHVSQLGPFDYQSPPRTRSLWFAEGLTEYYAQMFLVRNNMRTWEEYIEGVDAYLSRTYNHSQQMSITELSLGISELGIEQSIGLYVKGPVLALLLDIEIRLQTDNRMTLDDVMRYFNDKYGKTGRSFTDEEIIPIMESVTGAQLQDFYDRYIDGREALPFDRLLPAIGLKIVEELETTPALGADLDDDVNGWRVTEITQGQSADSTGLMVGDVITMFEVNDQPLADPSEYPSAVASQVFEQIPSFIPLVLNVKRGDATVKLKLTMVEVQQRIKHIRIDEQASTPARDMRRSMFGV